jgi:hypothetical protein
MKPLLAKEHSFASISTADRYLLAALVLLTAALAFAPVGILGPAIGWPASLRNPAAMQLAAIAANADAVALGYGVYALYSIAILPVAVIVMRRTSDLRGPLAATVIALAALSALARLIGILRWLTVMPELAKAHATGDAAMQSTTVQIFSALNAYGGGIGELLGVALLGGLWLLLAMIGAIRNASLPLWLSVFGLISALLQLALVLPAVGVATPVPVAIAVSSFALWLIAFAVVFVRGGNSQRSASA